MEMAPDINAFESEKISNAIRNLAEAGNNSSTILFQVVDFVAPRAFEHSLRYGDCSHIHSLYSRIKERCLSKADAFVLFLCKYGPFKITECNTAVVFKRTDRRENSFPKSFKHWCSKNKETIRKFKESFKLNDEFIQIKGKSIREIPGIHCYECGKLFDKGSTETIEAHNCIPARKSPSVDTISGGGGPGTGKRR